MKQLVPGVFAHAVFQEMSVIPLEDRNFKLAPGLNRPVQHHGVDQVINTEPGGQAPIEGLAINYIDRPVAGTRDQDVVSSHIPMNEGKAIQVRGSFDDLPGMPGICTSRRVKAGGEIASASTIFCRIISRIDLSL